MDERWLSVDQIAEYLGVSNNQRRSQLILQTPDFWNLDWYGNWGQVRPSRHQTAHSSNAGIQVILECPHYHCRHRDHAHDPKGADGLPRRSNHVRSAAVLQPRCLITRSATQLFSARLHYREGGKLRVSQPSAKRRARPRSARGSCEHPL